MALQFRNLGGNPYTGLMSAGAQAFGRAGSAYMDYGQARFKRNMLDAQEAQRQREREDARYNSMIDTAIKGVGMAMQYDIQQDKIAQDNALKRLQLEDSSFNLLAKNLKPSALQKFVSKRNEYIDKVYKGEDIDFSEGSFYGQELTDDDFLDPTRMTPDRLSKLSTAFKNIYKPVKDNNEAIEQKFARQYGQQGLPDEDGQPTFRKFSYAELDELSKGDDDDKAKVPSFYWADNTRTALLGPAEIEAKYQKYLDDNGYQQFSWNSFLRDYGATGGQFRGMFTDEKPSQLLSQNSTGLEIDEIRKTDEGIAKKTGSAQGTPEDTGGIVDFVRREVESLVANNQPTLSKVPTDDKTESANQEVVSLPSDAVQAGETSMFAMEKSAFQGEDAGPKIAGDVTSSAPLARYDRNTERFVTPMLTGNIPASKADVDQQFKGSKNQLDPDFVYAYFQQFGEEPPMYVAQREEQRSIALNDAFNKRRNQKIDSMRGLNPDANYLLRDEPTVGIGRGGRYINVPMEEKTIGPDTVAEMPEGFVDNTGFEGLTKEEIEEGEKKELIDSVRQNSEFSYIANTYGTDGDAKQGEMIAVDNEGNNISLTLDEDGNAQTIKIPNYVNPDDEDFFITPQEYTDKYEEFFSTRNEAERSLAFMEQRRLIDDHTMRLFHSNFKKAGNQRQQALVETSRQLRDKANRYYYPKLVSEGKSAIEASVQSGILADRFASSATAFLRTNTKEGIGNINKRLNDITNENYLQTNQPNEVNYAGYDGLKNNPLFMSETSTIKATNIKTSTIDEILKSDQGKLLQSKVAQPKRLKDAYYRVTPEKMDQYLKVTKADVDVDPNLIKTVIHTEALKMKDGGYDSSFVKKGDQDTSWINKLTDEEGNPLSDDEKRQMKEKYSPSYGLGQMGLRTFEEVNKARVRNGLPELDWELVKSGSPQEQINATASYIKFVIQPWLRSKGKDPNSPVNVGLRYKGGVIYDKDKRELVQTQIARKGGYANALSKAWRLVTGGRYKVLAK